MGLLDVPALDRILAQGCSACASKKLMFRTYVEGRVPIAEGEPNGAIVWAYKGETFLDGVFDVTCMECKHVVFHSEVCPRCHCDGALANVLESTNRFPVPAKCPRCSFTELRYVAMVPARVAYAGARGEKAKTATELYDPGFHGLRVECSACGVVAEVEGCCPLCAAAGPIRARPT